MGAELHDLVSKLKLLAVELDRTPTLLQFEDSGISKRDIQKHKYSNLCKLAGLEPNKHAQTTAPIEVIYRPPRILAFDIETAPISAYVWGLWENNVALNQIKEDWFILSYSAKFLDEDKTHYLDQRYSNPIQDDKMLCEGIHHLINEADILLTHNGDKFDIKKLNARFLYHGLDPIPPKQSIDTLKVAKKYFAMTSNKLEYIAKFLGCTEKDKHKNFPGFSMWSECLKSNIEAFKEMELYNLGDVLTLIEIYEKLIRYDHSIQFSSYAGALLCSCGSKEFIRDGRKYAKNSIRQMYKCKGCKKVFIMKENLIVKENKGQLPA